MKTNRFGALMLLMLAAIISWSTANAQSFTVKGIVTDAESGEAIIGCSVVIDGTRNGTTTGTDGTYSIHVSKGATLVFSFVGYRTQKIKVVSTRIDVALKADTCADYCNCRYQTVEQPPHAFVCNLFGIPYQGKY